MFLVLVMVEPFLGIGETSECLSLGGTAPFSRVRLIIIDRISMAAADEAAFSPKISDGILVQMAVLTTLTEMSSAPLAESALKDVRREAMNSGEKFAIREFGSVFGVYGAIGSSQ